jgi:aminopeptidase N
VPVIELVSLTLAFVAQQLPPETVAEARRLAAIAATDHAPPPRTVDVLHYALHVSVDVAHKSIEGSADVALRPFGAARKVVQLDADELAVKSVTDAAKKPLAFTQKGKVLEVDLGAETPPEQEVHLVVAYTAAPRRGLVFVPGADGLASMVWSQDECEMASAWFPCRDFPDDRASSELWVTLPDAWKSVSNGVLIESTPAAAGQRTDHWRMDFPHPAYLTSVALGPFVELDLGRVRDLPLLAYATADHQAAAAASLQPTGAMVELLEKLTGVPYPYPAYRQVAVAAFPYGGMENVAATTLSADDLATPDRLDEKRREVDALVVHELAHQWFGDLVSPASWADTWLSEGFATFAEAYWTEQRLGPDEALAEWAGMQKKAVEHRAECARPIVSAHYAEPDDVFDAVVYQQAGCFLNLLRRTLGEEKFDAGVKAWIARQKGQSVATSEFEKTFEEVGGAGLADLFHEWLHAPGLPSIEFSWSFDETGKRLELSAHQKQSGDGVPEVYHVPVEVAWQVGDARRTTRMQLDARQCRVAVECEARPKFVRFNAGGALFGTLQSQQDAAAWREQLALDSDPLGRIEAAGELAAAWPSFKPDDADARQRTTAALARALIEDKVVPVRAAAAAALGKVGGELARNLLHCGAWDVDRRVREASVAALGEMADDAAAFEILRDRLAIEPTLGVKSAVVAAMAKVGKGRTSAALLGVADNPKAPVELRGAALLAVAKLDGLAEAETKTCAEKAAAWSTGATDHELRKAAIAALGELAPKSDAACDALGALLGDPSLQVVAAALEALDNEKTPVRALAALVRFHATAAFPDQRSHAQQIVAKLVAKLPK